MKRLTWIVGATAVAAVMGLSAPASNAGVDISFGINAPVGDDGNLFFSISSRYFDRDPRMVDQWARRFPNPDDLAVFLRITSQSRQSPDVVFRYRNQGMSWFDVGTHCGIPVDTWYVPVERDPGPPYGKAYGYWKKHQRNPNYAVRLSDRQVRDLVAMRMAHEYYGVAPEVAMNWRSQGRDVRTIMTREYRSRHSDNDRHHGNDNDQGDRGHGNHGHDDHGNKHGDHGRDKR